MLRRPAEGIVPTLSRGQSRGLVRLYRRAVGVVVRNARRHRRDLRC